MAVKTAQPIEIAIEDEDEECKDDGEDDHMGGLKRIKTDWSTDWFCALLIQFKIKQLNQKR